MVDNQCLNFNFINEWIHGIVVVVIILKIIIILKIPELFRKDHQLIIHVMTSPVFENGNLTVSS
jgi:hypothetical protein